MAALIEPGTVADLSPEELFCGDANEVLSVRGNGPFHCQATKKGRGLVYFAYPEGFAGRLRGLEPDQPTDAGLDQATDLAGRGLSVDSRSGTARAGSHRGAEASTTRHQR